MVTYGALVIHSCEWFVVLHQTSVFQEMSHMERPAGTALSCKQNTSFCFQYYKDKS